MYLPMVFLFQHSLLILLSARASLSEEKQIRFSGLIVFA